MANDSATAGQSTVVAVFDTTADAENALDSLRGLGVRPEQVSVMMRHQRDAEQMAVDSGVNVAGGAATGAISGGLFGGLAGWLIGLGALAIPGIGPVLGAGVLASVLTGAVIGAAAGGLLGALVGIGVPEEEARTYESYVKEGRVLFTIAAADSQVASKLRDALEQANAYDVRVYGGLSQEQVEALGTDPYYDEGAALEDANQEIVLGNMSDTPGPEPENAPIRGEAIGGAGGALVGGVIGAVIGGPAGAAIGAAVGGGVGAGAAHVAEEPNTGPVGSPIGGASGAFVGGMIGAVGGPVGAVIGAVAGGALGGATGEALQDAGEFVQESPLPPDRDTGLADQPIATAPATTTTPTEDVTGASAMTGPATTADATTPTTTPTDFRSGGEAARNSTPDQLAQTASRGLDATADEAPANTVITPGTTETEFRSGGEASRH